MAELFQPTDEEIQHNIKKWNIPMPQKDYMVVVQCSTYNQEAYIEDALKGFVMQKTNFPFCALVTDDCSTDGTAAIIKKYAVEYPDIIIPILLGENHMQHKKTRYPYIGPWHKRAKYIAICEGDDYWTDPLKLQKQVDFMESNSNCVLSQHAALKLYPDGSVQESRRCTETVLCCTPENVILEEGAGITCSTMFKTELDTIQPDWRTITSAGDLVLILIALNEGDVGYIDEVMGCYRVSAKGSWTQRIAENYHKNLQHYGKIIQMYLEYNAWSNRKFEPVIKRKIREIKIRRFKYILLHYKNMLCGE